jgi:uncharacterized protein YqfA (UPF0365 family)
MTKQEFIWVLVRGVGVCLIALAITNALFLVGLLLDVAGASNATPNAIYTVIGMFLRVIILWAVGSYLIRDGRFLFKLLNR